MHSLAAERTIDTAVLDFDGLIADSGRVFTESAQRILRRPNPFTDDEIDRLRKLSVPDQMKELGVKQWQLKFYGLIGRQMVVRRMGEVKVFDGMPEALGELSETHKLYLLSSNSKKAIGKFIDKYDLPLPMSDVHAGSSILDKGRRLSGLLRSEGLLPIQCAYVGDEVRDIAAAREAEVASVAVEWGYATPDTLRTCKPDIMVASPADLAEAIRSL